MAPSNTSTVSGQNEGERTGDRSPLEVYESILWGMMDRLGVTESVERKMIAAVVLQFLATVGMVVIPAVFLGPGTIVEIAPTSLMIVTAVVFSLAVVAFVNTLLISRRDMVTPLQEMRRVADDIANGRLDRRPRNPDQPDEIGDLQGSFVSMHTYLTTVAAQADALSREDFEAEVLEEDVPGEFGDALEEMNHSLQERIDELQSQREAIDRQREEVAQRNEALEADAERCREVLDRCADGDFTHRVDAQSGHEAMEAIADGLNRMLDDVEETLSTVQTLSEEVDEVGTELSRNVAEIEEASAEVSRSADQISTATAAQTDRFQEVLAEMNGLSATIEEIAATVDDVATVSEHAAGRARSGSDSASDAIVELDRLERRTEVIVEEIEVLYDELGEVTDIVELIDEIAEETNMLALNASIEAARAGEAGGRFAVVASEVKSLAEETGEATDDVDDLVSTVQKSASDAVEEIHAMRTDVVESVGTIERSLEAIEEVAESVEEANDGVQSIDEATDEQARTSQQVVTMVDRATESSERTREEVGSVAAAAQQQTATISGIATSAQSLSESARQLNGLLEEFTVGTDSGRELVKVTDGGGVDEPT